MHGGLDPTAQIEKLKARLERERQARVAAESIAEKGLRDLYKRTQQINLLQRIAEAANRTSLVSEALTFAVREVCEFTGWAAGHVYVAAPGPFALQPTKMWHPDTTRFEAFRRSTEELLLESGVGLPGRVYASGRPAWISEIVEDVNFPRAAVALASGFRAAFAFPVLAGSEVVAVLEFFSMTSQEADETLLDVMGQIGIQLGRVIERRRSEDRLIYDASHDSLTGLANRTLFQDRLSRASELHRAGSSYIYAVLFVDLDRFKLVNDSLGHAAGDDLIVATARRLRETIETSFPQFVATLARLGGDEFTILLQRLSGPTDAVRVAESVQSVVHAAHELHGQTVHCSASIGIACVGAEPRSAADMLRDADIAMYRAKAQGRGRIEVFDQSMHAAALARLSIENDLRTALTRNEFVLYYQPIISFGSTRIVGFEALVRWRRGQDLILPGEFIPIAEETGLIIFLGEWVLKEACALVAKWCPEHPQMDGFTMSVNISPRHFAQSNFVATVKAIIQEAGVSPRLIRLELTESVTIVDADRTIDVLSQLRAFGVRIAIDDFGTGYSSLSYLQKLPLDVLKIDRSFVLAMGQDPGSRKIIQTIMSLAQGLGMDVIAEGAETASHVLELTAMGCQFGQGYYFSKPVDADRAVALLRANPNDWAA